MLRYILFDLDGTLTDSQEGVLNTLRYALEKMGRPVPADSVLIKFIGPPLQDSFPRFCGLDQEDTQRAIDLFHERYNTIGLFENAAAPGLPELCTRLKERGYVLALASSKPEPQCIRICEKFGFSSSLDVIVGSGPEVDWEKKDVILEALHRIGVDQDHLDQSLMVGDRRFDVLGAKACGLPCVGVEFFGYADPGELEEAGAVAVVDTAQQLEQYILTH